MEQSRGTRMVIFPWLGEIVDATSVALGVIVSRPKLLLVPIKILIGVNALTEAYRNIKEIGFIKFLGRLGVSLSIIATITLIVLILVFATGCSVKSATADVMSIDADTSNRLVKAYDDNRSVKVRDHDIIASSSTLATDLSECIDTTGCSVNIDLQKKAIAYPIVRTLSRASSESYTRDKGVAYSFSDDAIAVFTQNVVWTNRKDKQLNVATVETLVPISKFSNVLGDLPGAACLPQATALKSAVAMCMITFKEEHWFKYSVTPFKFRAVLSDKGNRKYILPVLDDYKKCLNKTDYSDNYDVLSDIPLMRTLLLQ
jgi:hypothetical protein